MNKNLKANVKSQIPKGWLCELRILHRLGMETLSDIIRTGWVNVIIITTILMIFGACFRTALSISAFSKEFGKALEISVYLKNSADPANVKSEIQKFDHVEDIKIITKAESWNRLKNEMSLPNIDNPLPDTLRVKVDSPESLQPVFDDIKQIQSVEDMYYAKDLANLLELPRDYIYKYIKNNEDVLIKTGDIFAFDVIDANIFRAAISSKGAISFTDF